MTRSHVQGHDRVTIMTQNMWPGHLILGGDLISGRATRVNNPQIYFYKKIPYKKNI